MSELKKDKDTVTRLQGYKDTMLLLGNQKGCIILNLDHYMVLFYQT